jgi:hypothetical protein
MATTSPDNIRYPVSTDQIAPLETHFANLANDVQTALTTTSTGGGVLIHKVASSAARDALYPSPIQGQQVFRNDTGLMQTYYGLYNVSTNPGGRSTAGWYNNPPAQTVEIAGLPAGATPIIKTGYAQVAFTSGVGTLVLPTAFPTKILSLSLTPQYPAGQALVVLYGSTTTLPLQNISVGNQASVTGTIGVHYYAIGY